MKVYTPYFTTIVFLFISFLKLQAVPATPYPVTYTQPDGTVITVQLYGDEFFSYKTTIDGYPVIGNEKGIYTYALVNENGQFTATDIKVRQIGERNEEEVRFINGQTPFPDLSEISVRKRLLSSAMDDDQPDPPVAHPTIGSPKCLVVLVNFSDVFFRSSNAEQLFSALLNEPGYDGNGATGSVKDYFTDNSSGVFSPDFVVYGPVDLPQSRAYYGQTDAITGAPYTRQMVLDACRIMDEKGFDFSPYDNNGDGYVDNISFYFAGHNRAEGGPTTSIHPHKFVLADRSTIYSGKRIYDYLCVSELKGAYGADMCGIGTFTHEFSHALGLKDYYATNGASHHTLNVWDAMDLGPYLNEGRTPPAHSAYSRFCLGWLTPVELKEQQRNVRLEPLSTGNSAFLITENGNYNMDAANPNPVEFFMLENRQNTGWDTFLPGHGMLITRIYFNQKNWNENKINNTPSAMGIDIIEADGVASGSTLSGDTYPGAAQVYSYSPTLRSGKDIQKPIGQIRENNGTITFRFMVTDAPEIFANAIIEEFSTEQGTPSQAQAITVSGKQLQSGLSLTFRDNKHFEMKKEGVPDTEWSKTLELEADNDSEVKDINVLIRYNPSEPSYQNIQNDTISIEAYDTDPLSFALSGKSTRPVYVIPPVATEATEVTSGSFIANWNEVFDASGYYLTMFQMMDSVSQINEDFTQKPDLQSGWTTSSASYTASAAQSGIAPPAIRFNNNDDYILTDKYMSPIVNLSFHVKSINATGHILVHGLIDKQWNRIDSITVNTRLDISNSYEFDNTTDYRQVRITFGRKTGSIALDDINIGFTRTANYIDNDVWTTTNQKRYENLNPDEEYFYYVKASDRTLNEDNALKYENITDISNVVAVHTLEESNGIPDIHSNEEVLMLLSSYGNEPVHIYNTFGMKLKTVQSQHLFPEIESLDKGQLYILQKDKIRIKILL